MTQQLPVGHGLFIIWASRSLRHTEIDRIPLDEWSTRRRDLYLTPHDTQNRHPDLRRVIAPAIPARERPADPLL